MSRWIACFGLGSYLGHAIATGNPVGLVCSITAFAGYFIAYAVESYREGRRQ